MARASRSNRSLKRSFETLTATVRLRRIAGFPDLPHPAFAEKRLKFVRAKFFACGKRQWDWTSLSQRTRRPYCAGL
jgi:hypothetical protein